MTSPVQAVVPTGDHRRQLQRIRRPTRRTTWRSEAACVGHDPELFFPIGRAEPGREQLERAREVCDACPVRLACLAFALSTETQYGVWGGLGEDERRFRSQQRREPAPGRPCDDRRWR